MTRLQHIEDGRDATDRAIVGVLRAKILAKRVEKVSALGGSMTRTEKFVRGVGAGKRRKWEKATNDYQSELAKAYEDWAEDLADDLVEEEGTDEERDEVVEEALAVLALSLTRRGQDRIVAGGLLGAGKSPPSPQFLQRLASRVEAYGGSVEGLTLDLRRRIRTALSDPAVLATGAAAILGALMAVRARVERGGAGAMWSAIQEGVGETARDAEEDGTGGQVAWQRDEQAKHCQDCEEFGEDEFPGRTYESWDDMLAETSGRLPGEVECSANCRCSLWVEVNGEWTREGYS